MVTTLAFHVWSTERMSAYAIATVDSYGCPRPISQTFIVIKWRAFGWWCSAIDRPRWSAKLILAYTVEYRERGASLKRQKLATSGFRSSARAADKLYQSKTSRSAVGLTGAFDSLR